MGRTKTEIIAREGWIKGGAVFILALFFEAMEMEFVSFLTLLLCGFVLYFFRNVERIPGDESVGAFISPIDGELRDIIRSEDTLTLVISNNILDGHMIRSPINSNIKKIESTTGYAFSNDTEAEKLNSKASLELVYGESDVKMEFLGKNFPTSALLYKELVTTDVKSGSRIGLLLTGEAKIILPKDARLMADIGNRVVGGETLLAFLK